MSSLNDRREGAEEEWLGLMRSHCLRFMEGGVSRDEAQVKLRTAWGDFYGDHLFERAWDEAATIHVAKR